MNHKVDRSLLEWKKFMPRIRLRQSGYTNSACGSFAKTKERTEKFKKIGHSRCIYQSKLNIDCFQHDTECGNFQDLSSSTDSDKVLQNKAFNVARI